jgi:hypothetical protein
MNIKNTVRNSVRTRIVVALALVLGLGAAGLSVLQAPAAWAEDPQVIYLKGTGSNFDSAGWVNTFELGGALPATCSSPSIWHLVYTGDDFSAVESMKLTFTNGEEFNWTPAMGPSTNNGGGNPSWIIIAPCDWVIAYVNSGNNNESESFLTTSESGNINFNISGFNAGGLSESTPPVTPPTTTTPTTDTPTPVVTPSGPAVESGGFVGKTATPAMVGVLVIIALGLGFLGFYLRRRKTN